MPSDDGETNAIQVCFAALEPLSPNARQRVMDYLNERLMKDEIDRAMSIVMMLHSIGKLRMVLEEKEETCNQ